ncbi:MAG: sigma-54-dependent Fis family transcriptional regulator [Candidatus Aminicenantes bacterium]|nr:sigma-54-dependent Fis family transcriptional regulator [Candidatus Aminicenantes bacterium]
MSKDKILVIDDESNIRSSLQGILEDEGYAVQTAESGEDGLRLLEKQNFDLLLLDVWLPEMSGLDVLKRVKPGEESPLVVMISGHGTIETAVQATKLGAYDFLEKPLSLEKVVVTVQNALRQRRLEVENIELREKTKTRYHLAGESRSIRKLREEIGTAAPSNGRVLIYGENGTGKEVIARLIHQQSRRKGRRFVEINCAAAPDEVIESELFGYVRDHVPLAAKDKKGKFLLADGGTLFLDEIGEMSLKTQAKLVRVLEEQEYEPLGSAEPVPVDVRLVAATGKNLKELIAKDKFREDLFFKLNVIPLIIPPLRERKEDIPVLIDAFLRDFADEYGKKPKTMAPAAVEAFLNYAWPGNVSELMNVIERFVIMVAEPEIDAAHLSLLVEARELEVAPGLAGGLTLHQALEEYERHFIHRVLTRNRWDLGRAARALGVEDEHLRGRIKALNITLID